MATASQFQGDVIEFPAVGTGHQLSLFFQSDSHTLFATSVWIKSLDRSAGLIYMEGGWDKQESDERKGSIRVIHAMNSLSECSGRTEHRKGKVAGPYMILGLEGGVQEGGNQLNATSPQKRCNSFVETNPSLNPVLFENKDRGSYSLVTEAAFSSAPGWAGSCNTAGQEKGLKQNKFDCG